MTKPTNDRLRAHLSTLARAARPLVNRAETAVSRHRLLIGITIIAATLWATGAMLQSDAGRRLWFWAALVMAVGGGVNLHTHWSSNGHFVRVRLWKLVAATAVYLLASVTVVWWLSVPGLPPDSAAFIATATYAPAWMLAIRSYSS